MSADNCNGHNGHGTDDSTDHGIDWQRVARNTLTELFYTREMALRNSLGAIEAGLADRDSDVTAEDIEEFRDDFYRMQRMVEENIVPLVAGVEQYERSTTNISDGRLAESLDIRWEDVVEAGKRDSECRHEGVDTDADE